MDHRRRRCCLPSSFPFIYAPDGHTLPCHMTVAPAADEPGKQQGNGVLISVCTSLLPWPRRAAATWSHEQRRHPFPSFLCSTLALYSCPLTLSPPNRVSRAHHCSIRQSSSFPPPTTVLASRVYALRFPSLPPHFTYRLLQANPLPRTPDLRLPRLSTPRPKTTNGHQVPPLRAHPQPNSRARP